MMTNPIQTALSALLWSHRSIRKFTNQQVPQELLEEVINEAVVGGSSSGNLNSYSFVISRDGGKKAMLEEAHFGQGMVTECSVVLTVCADWWRVRQWLKLRSAKDGFSTFHGYHVAVVDAIIIAQNIALGLQARGLGMCYLGTTQESMQEISDLLELPETVVPITTLVIGYPAEAPAKRDRLPVRAYIHSEVYRNPEPKELEEVYNDREVKGWQRYMAIPEMKERMENSGVSSLAEFYTSDYKYPESGSLETSRRIMDFLEKKGFMRANQEGEKEA
ncbi:putative oxidoreductase [Chytriomyces sp. MP71]|nr:putative oxidoreductase [Chytriomyces sp. MP71]